LIGALGTEIITNDTSGLTRTHRIMSDFGQTDIGTAVHCVRSVTGTLLEIIYEHKIIRSSLTSRDLVQKFTK